jgi:hypothetical protein
MTSGEMEKRMRQEFMARLSCATIQRGSHIDSLPTHEPVPPERSSSLPSTTSQPLSPRVAALLEKTRRMRE